MCRRLKLWDTDSTVSTLVGNKLHCLEIDLFWKDNAVHRRAVQKIGACTALTRLELSDVRSDGADFAAVRKLPLQELVLLHCQNMEVALLVPGALLLLEKIHIEDSDKKKQRLSRKPELMEKLAVCGEVVVGLPRLLQLSGSGMLFSIAMKGLLEKWHVAEYSDGSITTSDHFQRYNMHSKLRVWTKP